MKKRAMRLEFSWDSAAREYEALYLVPGMTRS